MSRIREKKCDRCSDLSSVMYRVRYDESGQWCFVCPTCWPKINEDNPLYQYGGTWKAKKKK